MHKGQGNKQEKGKEKKTTTKKHSTCYSQRKALRSPKTLQKLAERWEVLCLLPFQMVSASDYGFLSDLG